MSRPGGSGDVRISGQRVQYHHDVVAGWRQFAPPLHGDVDVVYDHTAFQRQRTDVDYADFAFGGERMGRHV